MNSGKYEKREKSGKIYTWIKSNKKFLISAKEKNKTVQFTKKFMIYEEINKTI